MILGGRICLKLFHFNVSVEAVLMKNIKAKFISTQHKQEEAKGRRRHVIAFKGFITRCIWCIMQSFTWEHRENKRASVRTEPYGACLAKKTDLVYSAGVLRSELHDSLTWGCGEAGRFTKITIFDRFLHNLLLTTRGEQSFRGRPCSCSPLAPSAPLPAKADSAQLRNHTGPNRQITHAV